MLEEAGAEPEAQCSGSSAIIILWSSGGWVNESVRRHKDLDAKFAEGAKLRKAERRERRRFRSHDIRLTCGLVGGYFPTNIDILLATLANPMAAKLAADRVAEGCGRPGTDESHKTSNRLRLRLRQLLHSPDRGQAPTW